MVNLSLSLVALSVASLAVAHSGVRADGGPAHLAMVKRSRTNDLTSGKLHKRCSGHSTQRSRKNYKSRASSSSATSTGDSSSTTKAVQVKAAVQKGSDDKKTSSSAKVFSTWAETTTTTSAKAAATSTPAEAGDYDGGDTSGKGLFGVYDDTCGDSGATETPSNDGGPNGKESWLNCGVSGGGWTPPSIKLSQLKTLSLDAAVAQEGSVFSACKPYLSHFDKVGAQYNIPPILLASIAMQESSCNPNVRGDNGGAFGLMQITEDKWYPGLTTGGAMKIRTSCWDCQQNLDYFQQLLNGWLLGLDGSKLGNVRNLDQ